MRESKARKNLRKRDAALFNEHLAGLRTCLNRWLNDCVKDDPDDGVKNARFEAALALAVAAIYEIGIEHVERLMGTDYARELLVYIFEKAADHGGRGR
ncbi:hypothetical protein [Hyphomicrobium sp.]|jgi:hypothetical protein|uniref:hypothetical protein n=1 Tax=Hyphomicrobium sp. TaxID=82 RepID=UPI003568A450